MSDSTNPDVGVTDVDSAIQFLVTPETAREEDKDAAAQESQADAESQVEEAEVEEEEVEAQADEVEADADEEIDNDAAEDSDDSEAGEPEDDRKYTVKVDGHEFEVNEAELIAGYQKGADYHRKTTALAEKERALQSQAQMNEQLRVQLAGELQKVAQASGEQEPDWQKLASELDPWEYQQQRANWDAKVKERQQAAATANAIQAQQSQKVLLENGVKLVEHFPEWKNDPKRFEADRNEMLQVAQAYGYTPKEFFDAADHRVFLMLRDAMNGRKAREAKTPVRKKVRKPAPKSLKPGVATTSSEKQAKSKDALRKNLRQRGDVDSAVAFLTGS